MLSIGFAKSVNRIDATPGGRTSFRSSSKLLQFYKSARPLYFHVTNSCDPCVYYRYSCYASIFVCIFTTLSPWRQTFSQTDCMFCKTMHQIWAFDALIRLYICHHIHIHAVYICIRRYGYKYIRTSPRSAPALTENLFSEHFPKHDSNGNTALNLNLNHLHFQRPCFRNISRNRILMGIQLST